MCFAPELYIEYILPYHRYYSCMPILWCLPTCFHVHSGTYWSMQIYFERKDDQIKRCKICINIWNFGMNIPKNANNKQVLNSPFKWLSRLNNLLMIPKQSSRCCTSNFAIVVTTVFIYVAFNLRLIFRHSHFIYFLINKMYPCIQHYDICHYTFRLEIFQ